MTIRFTCNECGSVLKIKDELAGTRGKCPKCKAEFIVPVAASAMQEVIEKSVSAILPPTASESSTSPSNDPSTSAAASVAELIVTTHSGTSDNGPEGADAHLLRISDDQDSESDPFEDVEMDSPPVLVMESLTKVSSKAKSASVKEFDPAEFLNQGTRRSGRSPNPFPQSDQKSIDHEDQHAQSGAAIGLGASNSTKSNLSIEETSDADSSGHADAAKLMIQAARASRDQTIRTSGRPNLVNFDHFGFFVFSVKALGILLVAFVICMGTYSVVDRMLGKRLRLPPLGYVTGTVSLDGNPLAGVVIYFAPEITEFPNGQKERARTSLGKSDERGRYTMYYTDTIQGVAAGNCRVWLDHTRTDGRQTIPFNHTEFTVTIKKVDPISQIYDFDMTSGR